MASLQVRECPPHIYQRLEQLAEQEHRSLAQETVAVLARGLGLEENPSARRKRVLEQLRRNPPIRTKESYPDPAALIREDRER